MILTDTHCHLNHEQFADDGEAALERALESNVRRLLVVGYDLASSRRAVSWARRSPYVEAIIGIHPETPIENLAETVGELAAMAADPANRVVAWGEIGLDYHWDTVARPQQVAAFEAQIDTAARAGLPVVIHCRDAYSDVLDILAAHPTLPAELHCFTGTVAEAQRAVSQGLYIGVGGIITFKKSDELRATIAAVPLDRILLETDSPYLAPQAHRGKRCEPAFVVYTAEKLAEMHGLSVDSIAAITTENAERFFGAARPFVPS